MSIYNKKFKLPKIKLAMPQIPIPKLNMKALGIALILVIIGIFSLIIDPITAVFISGYIIGVLLTKKVDIKEYILFSICWLVAVVFLGVHIYLINNLLLLIIFILLTIFDEKGNNYADNYFKKFKNKNYFVLLLRFRIIVLIGAIILSVLGLLPLEYVLLIFIWLLGYNLPIFISEQLKH